MRAVAHGLRLPAKGNTAFNSAARVRHLETAEYKTCRALFFAKLSKIAHHVRDVTLELQALKFPFSARGSGYPWPL